MQSSVGGGKRNPGLQPHTGIKGLDLIPRDFERKIDIAVSPGKPRPRYADYGVVLVDHLNGLAEYRRVGIKMPLPELVTQHNHGLRVLAIDGI